MKFNLFATACMVVCLSAALPSDSHARSYRPHDDHGWKGDHHESHHGHGHGHGRGHGHRYHDRDVIVRYVPPRYYGYGRPNICPITGRVIYDVPRYYEPRRYYPLYRSGSSINLWF